MTIVMIIVEIFEKTSHVYMIQTLRNERNGRKYPVREKYQRRRNCCDMWLRNWKKRGAASC